MPNAKVLSEKKEIVLELSEKLKSSSGVLVDFSGITVNEDTELRVKLREAGIDYTVVKNTLMRFAIKNVGFEDLEPVLTGTTSLAVTNDDPVAPARIIKEYADTLNDRFEIKGGFMDGKILSVSEVNALAKIPPLPILHAQLLGTMLAPITSLAVVLKAISEKDANEPEAAPETPEEKAAAEPEAAPETPEEKAAAEPEAAQVPEQIAKPEEPATLPEETSSE